MESGVERKKNGRIYLDRGGPSCFCCPEGGKLLTVKLCDEKTKAGKGGESRQILLLKGELINFEIKGKYVC